MALLTKSTLAGSMTRAMSGRSPALVMLLAPAARAMADGHSRFDGLVESLDQPAAQGTHDRGPEEHRNTAARHHPHGRHRAHHAPASAADQPGQMLVRDPARRESAWLLKPCSRRWPYWR